LDISAKRSKFICLLQVGAGAHIHMMTLLAGQVFKNLSHVSAVAIRWHQLAVNKWIYYTLHRYPISCSPDPV